MIKTLLKNLAKSKTRKYSEGMIAEIATYNECIALAKKCQESINMQIEEINKHKGDIDFNFGVVAGLKKAIEILEK